ncbi:MAG: cytochrome c biogenesis protein CcdA [Thermodesulfobacteriota bacterium]
MAPGIGEALCGGFFTFFSVWQLCVMQVTPFYIAFGVGTYLLIRTGGIRGLAVMGFVAAALALGFSVTFGLLSVPALEPGGTILRNIKVLRPLAGAFIAVAATLMAFFSIAGPSGRKSAVMVVLAPLVGAAFAIGYAPCIAPALGELLNYAAMPDNSKTGFTLLTAYGLGLSAAFTVVGAAISLVLAVVGRAGRGKAAAEEGEGVNIPALIASLVLMSMGVLLMTGLMLRYKAFLVNLM